MPVIFDQLVTSMKLETVVYITRPAHLTWARHSADVSASTSLETWLAKTSSSSLRAHLCTSDASVVLQRQYSFWAERLTSVLKMEDASSQSDALLSLFDLEGDYEVEDRLQLVLTIDVYVGG